MTPLTSIPIKLVETWLIATFAPIFAPARTYLFFANFAAVAFIFAPVKFDSRTLVARCSWSAGMTWSGGSGAEGECIGGSGRVCGFAGGTVCAGERVKP